MDNDDTALSNRLMSVSQITETYLDTMKPIYESVAAEEGNSSSSSFTDNRNRKVVNDTNAVTMNILNSVNEIIKTRVSSSSAVQDLLKFLLVLFPLHTRRMLSMEFYKIAFEIIDRLVTRSGTNVNSFSRCLKVFHHVARHLSVMDSAKKNELGSSHLCQTLNRIELLIDNSPVAIQRNITCLQLMSYLAELLATRDLVSEKLNVDTLEVLLDILSHEDESLSPQVQLNKSICAVELLNLVSQYSEKPQIIDLIKKSISSHATYTHIANCIINAPEEIVERALHLTASFGIYGKELLTGVTKVLVVKRDGARGFKDCIPVAAQTFSENSFTGANNFMETSISIEDLVEMDAEIEGLTESLKLNPDAPEDVSEKIKTLEASFEKLKVQSKGELKQLSSITEKLKLLESKNKELRYDIFEIKKLEIENATKGAKEIESLKESLKSTKDAHKDVSKKLETLRDSYQNLMGQSEEVLKERSSLTEKVKLLKTENKELVKELKESKKNESRLEGEVKKKEEELLDVTTKLQKNRRR